jgi:2-oxoglutarate ferredoxin oxidoreductase subunit gamma
MRQEIRFSGSGGQGLITVARVLAKTAILDNVNALQSQTYGAEARGGATKSEVIISNDKIYFPEVELPDMLIMTTQEAYQKFSKTLKPGGVMIIDSFLVKEYTLSEDYTVYAEPFTGYAARQFQAKILMNILVTGFAVGILREILTIDSYTKALADFFGGEKLKKNILAAHFGYELAESRTPIHFT